MAMPIANAARMAGQKLLTFLKGDLTTTQLRNRLAPDAGFALVNAAMTPGDFGEKATAGMTDFLMSGGAGLAAGNLARNMGAGPGTASTADLIASFAGGYGSYPVSSAITRGIDKATGGPGLTSYEKLAEKDREAYAEQIRQQTLSAAGLIPGINPQYLGNPYLAQLGLG